MKTIILIITLICQVIYAQITPKKINVEINKNVETLVIIFQQADHNLNQWAPSCVQPLRIETLKYFSSYNGHPAIKRAEEFVKKGIGVDSRINIALLFSPFPEGKLLFPIDTSFCKSISSNNDFEEGKLQILQFIQLVNKFYRDANVEGFFKKYNSIYEGVINEVKKNLPKENYLNILEDYYGISNCSYTLIPSPTLYAGWGIGTRLQCSKGLNVFNIFGPTIQTDDTIKYNLVFCSDLNYICKDFYGDGVRL